MKFSDLYYGLALGLVLALLIVLGNVIIPNNGPDSSPGLLLVAGAIGLYVVWSAYISFVHTGSKRVALRVGAATSALGFSISMLTFIIIDNVFLTTVSKQSDKIWGFQHSSYPTMQAYINSGLLRGLIIGLPASIVFGALCGWAALVFRKTSNQSHS